MECGDGGRELGHRVEGGWEVVDHRLDVAWDLSTRGEFLRQSGGLVYGWHFACEEKPQNTFWEHLAATSCVGELFVAFEQRQATVPRGGTPIFVLFVSARAFFGLPLLLLRSDCGHPALWTLHNAWSLCKNKNSTG